MEPVWDYRRFAILYVDDEQLSLKAFRRAFESRFQIFTASSAQEAMGILEADGHRIGLLLTDQQMPGEKGVWLLERARQLWPRIVRILVTAYSDSDAAMGAVNAGAIYNYVLKPWNVDDLIKIIQRALQFFMVERERDQLLEEKNSLLQNMLMAERVASLGFLAAGMSHHIRNRLVTIKAFVEQTPGRLLAENLDPTQLRHPEFWHDFRQLAQSDIQRIETLLLELLFASKRDNTAFADAVSLRETIAQVLEKLSSRLVERGMEVENRIPDSLPSLLVEKPSFDRLFEMLLEDEIASLPRASRITISAGVVPASDSSQTEIHVRVQDNGPCLPNETLRRLINFFAPRSDHPGENGIRLMLCYFIALRHGGKIEVSSEPGVGTTFHLYFYTEPPTAPGDSSPEGPAPSLSAYQ